MPPTQRDQTLVWGGALVIFALNVYMGWQMFFTEVVTHYYSVEPIFFAISKAIRERWPDLGWWAGSSFGYPYEYAYQPLMHHLVALAAAVTGLTDARAYHVVLAVFAAFGPVAVYLLAWRLSRSVGASFVAGVLYGVYSAGGLLSGWIAEGMSGWWYSRRLHVAIVYGEGPHVMGLALLPLALLFLDRALGRRTVGSWLAAAVSMAAVVLTNIPATLALAIGVVCYALARPWREWHRDWLAIVAVGLLGFLLFAPWLPPSGFLLNIRNVAGMNPEGNFTAAKAPYLWTLLAIVVGSCVIGQVMRVPQRLRFVWTYALTIGFIAILSVEGKVDLIGQAGRLHVAMEIPIVLAAVLTVHALVRWTKVVGWVVAIALLGLCIEHAPRVHRRTRLISENGAIAGRSEAKIAAWMQEHARGERVLVSGSTSFWLNYLTDVAQVKGCCDQNVMVPAFRYFYPAITATPLVGDAATDPGIRWMQVTGVHYVAVSSGASDDAYRDFVHPGKFDGVLKERWRDGGDVIYEVPLASASLAHAIAREEVTPGDATDGIGEDVLERYRAGLMDGKRPEAKFQWVGMRDARIEGELKAGLVYSVQVPRHPGWRAFVKGNEIAVERDALNFMVIDPRCEGACEVDLHFDGGPEMMWLRVGAGVAWLGVLVLLVRRRVRLLPRAVP